MMLIKEYFKYFKDLPRIAILGIFVLFLLLLYKDPFSERTLIPNLEPYPDTIHYLSPAINFVRGNGMLIFREGRVLIPTTPPLYSFVNIPTYWINTDARMFYFTNVLLAVLSLCLFYIILKRLFDNFFIIGLSLFLYVTNYFIYWYPTLAMAENLVLPLYLSLILLLVSRSKKWRIVLVGVLAILLYATKYANVSVVLTILPVFGLRILFLDKKWREKMILWGILVLSFSASFLLYSLYEYFIKETIIFSPLLGFLSLFFNSAAPVAPGGVSSSSQSWVSTAYFNKNFGIYWGSLNGYPMNFLWDRTPLVPKIVGSFGLLGLSAGLFVNKYRLISIALLVFVFSQILFLSTFYTNDGRYIYHAIPSLILGFGIALQFLYNYLSEKNLRLAFYIIIFSLGLFYLTNSFMRLKYQIVLNIKYAETPWYYVSVDRVNKYFDKNPGNGKMPIVISSMPAYYIDFFSSGKYTLLPLSNDQEFRGKFDTVYGKENDYSSLISLYESKLKDGYPLYMAKYGLGNEVYLKRAFDEVLNRFAHKEVMNDCHNTCNLYKLELKDGYDQKIF